MGGKRVRSPSASDDATAEKKAATPLKRASTVKRISSGALGQMERSHEALVSLNTKKSEGEIWADVRPFQRRTTDADYNPANMFKIITWNVAGLRGVLKKDASALKDFLAAEQPDILCLQETKLNVDDAAANAGLGVVDGYVFVDHPCAYKKGYSGTRTYIRTSSMVEKLNAQCTRGFTLPSGSASAAPGALLVGGAGDEEGRVLTTFLTPNDASAASSASPSVAAPRLAIVNTYVPNSGMGLDRLPHRIQSFDPLMREYLKKLDEWSNAGGRTGGSAAALSRQPHGFIWTGDLNVAERDYDRYYAGTFKTMQECSGFTPEERSSFRNTMASTDAVDVFRHLYPNAGPVYTFWSMRINGRAKGLGWRLDYFVVSSRLMPYVVDCFPMPSMTKSDHCPVQLWLRKP